VFCQTLPHRKKIYEVFFCLSLNLNFGNLFKKTVEFKFSNERRFAYSIPDKNFGRSPNFSLDEPR
jgi:hypothetical protein